MSRRRYLSTDISIDKAVNQMGMQYGDAPVLLYTWMIPHAADDGTLPGDPFELLNIVWPGRRDKTEADVVQCLEAMEEFALITWDREAGLIYFPAASFYKYQTYIKPANRRRVDPISGNQRKTPASTAEQRESAENTASLSLSHSLPGSDPSDLAAEPPPAPRKTPTPEAKAVTAYLKTQLQQRGVTAFPRDWHLKGAAVAQALIRQGIPAETLRAVIDWALADAFWGRQVTSMTKVADLVPRWQLAQRAPPAPPEPPAPGVRPSEDPTFDALLFGRKEHTP